MVVGAMQAWATGTPYPGAGATTAVRSHPLTGSDSHPALLAPPHPTHDPSSSTSSSSSALLPPSAPAARPPAGAPNRPGRAAAAAPMEEDGGRGGGGEAAAAAAAGPESEVDPSQALAEAIAAGTATAQAVLQAKMARRPVSLTAAWLRWPSGSGEGEEERDGEDEDAVQTLFVASSAGALLPPHLVVQHAEVACGVLPC